MKKYSGGDLFPPVTIQKKKMAHVGTIVLELLLGIEAGSS
jgi:hypothetical protein